MAFRNPPTTLPPSGAAGGALDGNYPDPGIANGAIVNADIANAAAIALTKLAGYPFVNGDIDTAAAIALTKLARYPIHPVRGGISGVWLWPPGSIGTLSVAITTNQRCFFIPFFVGVTTTFDRIGCEVTTAGNAASVIRLGIYADDGNGKPGALILDAGTVAGDGATGLRSIVINQQLTPGLYWLVMCPQNAATTAPTVRRATSGFALVPTDTQGQMNGIWIQSGVAGALPSPATPTVTGVQANNPPVVQLRTA